jgi:hypothetical protein
MDRTQVEVAWSTGYRWVREIRWRRSRDDHTGGGDWERERGTWQEE